MITLATSVRVMRLNKWINRRNLFILFRIQVPEISKREHEKSRRVDINIL